jgi:hypothetical protein
MITSLSLLQLVDGQMTNLYARGGALGTGVLDDRLPADLSGTTITVRLHGNDERRQAKAEPHREPPPDPPGRS